MMKLSKGILFSPLVIIFIHACSISQNVLPVHDINLPNRPPGAVNGSEFYAKSLDLNLEEREEQIVKEITSGNFPDFMRNWVRINCSIGTKDGKNIAAFYYVMPDYLMIGSDDDFFRVPMTPQSAQKIADIFGCFLTTSKICDDIFDAAVVKLEPFPLTQNRDSFTTFYLHNQIIEKQRKGEKGLIAGIKKDVIISSAVRQDRLPNRVAIYGWHQPDGNPIQPVYAGHVDWYVDYSHGIRLVHRIIYVNNQPTDYKDVLRNPDLKQLLSNETGVMDFFAYPY
ncbi:MAG: hypothetical protein ABFC30_04725 [Proteiniphilum sp.]